MCKWKKHPPTRLCFHIKLTPHMWELVGILPRLLKPFFQYLTIFSNGKHFVIRVKKKLNGSFGRKTSPWQETCFNKWVYGKLNKTSTYKLMLSYFFYPSQVRNGGHLPKAIYAIFRCKTGLLVVFKGPIFS